ncbi:unnamed protein product [Clonostachys solani]|uniref:Aminoglycoside phosphotransferase domain-containing protein n=1 Tax=Clonostachys solani TaxID=160281 RepID=A0A9P0E8V1_9HYPO|nr:unnamed protein product [Clonostachys solani]
MANSPKIDIYSLPDISQPEMDFRDTSFFRHQSAELPTPASLLRQYPDLGAGVLKFSDQNLVIKVGGSSELHLEEAQVIYGIRHAFPTSEVPVPELFGWRKHGDMTFIYMSLISGKTLREAWDDLQTDDKTSICVQLSQIVTALRSIKPDTPQFIGSINGGTLQDRYFRYDYEGGPFLSIKSYNDWLFAAATRQNPEKEELKFPDGLLRDYLSDEGQIYFTHGDLTVGNIIVSGPPGAYRIVGIIDWEQAGWYPEYWEYCKLLYGVEYDHPWREEGWADKVMRPFPREIDAFGEYSHWRGCP